MTWRTMEIIDDINDCKRENSKKQPENRIVTDESWNQRKKTVYFHLFF